MPRFRAFGLKRVSDGEKYLDLALIKLGKSRCDQSQSVLKKLLYSGNGVNDCKSEEKERCWQIKPATLATDDSNLNRKSFLRAFGKGK